MGFGPRPSPTEQGRAELKYCISFLGLAGDMAGLVLPLASPAHVQGEIRSLDCAGNSGRVPESQSLRDYLFKLPFAGCRHG